MSQTADARVDVREIDGEPFPVIVAALEDLGEAETLELLAPFEPVPLYAELSDRGFTHETDEAGDLYRVHVERE